MMFLPIIINKMQLSIAEQGRKIYEQYIKEVAFQQIEHAPDDFISQLIVLKQNCLCVSHRFFDLYYPTLNQIISHHPQLQDINWACEMVLVMNGENDKAWNIKKRLIQANLLDLQRQLRFNAAVCYKNKKSSSYYEYRLRVVGQLLKRNSKTALLALYDGETKLIKKILSRFFRNYYCWMYRNRLFSMCLEVCGQQLVVLEVQSLHKWIQNNPNDYSAYSRLITIVRDRPCLAEKQFLWLNQLVDFCSVAYQQNVSYRHTETYMQYLTGLISKIK